MDVYFCAKNGIVPPLPISNKHSQYTFKVKTIDHSMAVDININNNGKEIDALSSLDVSSEFYKSLCDNKEFKYVDNLVLDEYRKITLKFHEIISNVFNTIKQELFLYELRWLTAGPIEWSIDRVNWKIIPWAEGKGYGWGHILNELDDKWSNSLQILFDEAEYALYATEHLHEAFRSHVDRFKWLQATIAAELAIKEVLGRIEPKLKVILFKLPSPPIEKLYRDVLKEITGEASPFVKKLKEGAEIRNKLIHSPDSVKLDGEEVQKYISMVKSAIEHLLGIERNIRQQSRNKDAWIPNKINTADR